MAIWLAEGETLPSLEEAELLAGRIRARFPGAETWLFGSLARGRPRRGSDIDLAVVLPDAAFEDRRMIDVVTALRHAAGPREHALDVVAFRRSWFDAMAGDPSALAATVRREGRRLA
ncbi:MAG: nucleotidyltransferase domain-containing protein [Acetobacteraceae bacterium]|nr:nucleotidyltransferase domain-containing protein [Acetobacteraceae bacterium]